MEEISQFRQVSREILSQMEQLPGIEILDTSRLLLTLKASGEEEKALDATVRAMTDDVVHAGDALGLRVQILADAVFQEFHFDPRIFFGKPYAFAKIPDCSGSDAGPNPRDRQSA